MNTETLLSEGHSYGKSVALICCFAFLIYFVYFPPKKEPQLLDSQQTRLGRATAEFFLSVIQFWSTESPNLGNKERPPVAQLLCLLMLHRG